MSTLITFGEALRLAKVREEKTGEEYCTSCATGMGFPSSLHIEHPFRSIGGACYVEGAGQTCAACALKLDEKYKIV